MKCGARVALGVASGYLLGRTKKMRLALLVGGMIAGRRAGGPGELLAQGTKLLARSPELTRLSEEIRGRLVNAGKQAAVTVATRQVESLTDRVSKRIDSLGDLTAAGKGGSDSQTDRTAEAAGEPEDEATEEVAEERSEPSRRPPRSGGDDSPRERPRRNATGTTGTRTAARAAGGRTGRPTRREPR